MALGQSASGPPTTNIYSFYPIKTNLKQDVTFIPLLLLSRHCILTPVVIKKPQINQEQEASCKQR